MLREQEEEMRFESAQPVVPYDAESLKVEQRAHDKIETFFDEQKKLDVILDVANKKDDSDGD